MSGFLERVRSPRCWASWQQKVNLSALKQNPVAKSHSRLVLAQLLRISGLSGELLAEHRKLMRPRPPSHETGDVTSNRAQRDMTLGYR